MSDELLDLAPVAELRELLEAAGIRNAQDPADLTPPGVLLQVTGWTRTTQAGPMYPQARVLVVVPNGHHERVTEQLVALTNQVFAVVDPDGPVSAAAVVLPSGPVPLPSLSFPLNLY